MAVYPFIFIHNGSLKSDPVLLNHEKIHLRQQAEMLIIPFYLWYVTEFLLRFIAYRNWHKAYRNISFEREAYANEKNIKHLSNRRLYNFLNYIKINDK